MITVVKRDPHGKEKTRYSARVLTRLEHGVILEAIWERPRKDLGYVVFEPGDRFVEYFYSDRWFNVFAISTTDNQFKGWYCDVAAPAQISEECIEQTDLWLDVWVSPSGLPLILDEDEFISDTTMTEALRQGAKQGLQELLASIEAHREPFTRVR